MHDIIYALIHSDVVTKVFIAGSILVLCILQVTLFRLKFSFVTIPSLHICFGFLLSRVTVYDPLVHLLLYILPSLLISGIILFLFSNKTLKNPDPLALSYKYNKGTLTLNPFSGVCILGTPKAGKTASIVKPTIAEMAQKNYCGIIYDYKMQDLTRCAYYHYKDHPIVDFKMINPFNLDYSSQINPISPSIIEHPAYATEAASVFLANMKGKGSSGDSYWDASASGVLAGIIWRLRADYPQFCDLPHAISILIKKDVKELTAFLEANDQSQMLAASYFKSLVSEKQTAGILGTLASSVSKVALPEIFYMMSENPSEEKINLALNDPKKPTLLCLSTAQELDKTYAPALALIISMALKLMNHEGRHHSAIVLDEAPTLIIPEFDRIPATARSNKIATFFIAQDMVQGEDGYGRIGRDKILATLSTHLYGKVMDPETAERYSKMFGTYDKQYTSTSQTSGSNNSSSGRSYSYREVRTFKPELFQAVDTGEFLGIIADGNMKKFRGKFDCYKEKNVTIPMVRNITKREVQQHFDRVIEESKNIF